MTKTWFFIRKAMVVWLLFLLALVTVTVVVMLMLLKNSRVAESYVTKADSEVKQAETEINETDMGVTALSENVGSTTVYRCLQLWTIQQVEVLLASVPVLAAICTEYYLRDASSHPF